MIYNPNSFKIEIKLCRPFPPHKNPTALHLAHDLSYSFDCFASASSTDHKTINCTIINTFAQKSWCENHAYSTTSQNSCALISFIDGGPKVHFKRPDPPSNAREMPNGNSFTMI